MGNGITLKAYLKVKSDEIKKAQGKLEKVRGLDFEGVFVMGYPHHPFFVSTDYSLANKVSIASDEDRLGGSSFPGGGYSRTKTLYYPEFSLLAREKPKLLIWPRRSTSYLPEDVICEVDKQRGYGDCSDESRAPIVRFPNSVDKLLERYKGLGVNEALLRLFERRAKSKIKNLREALC